MSQSTFATTSSYQSLSDSDDDARDQFDWGSDHDYEEICTAFATGDHDAFLATWAGLGDREKRTFWETEDFRECLAFSLPEGAFLLALQRSSDLFDPEMLAARVLGGSEIFGRETLEEQWDTVWAWWVKLEPEISEMTKIVKVVSISKNLGYSCQPCPGLIYILEQNEKRWESECPEQFSEMIDQLVFTVLKNSGHYDCCDMFGDRNPGPNMFQYAACNHIRSTRFKLGKYMTTERRISACVMHILLNVKSHDQFELMRHALAQFRAAGATVAIECVTRGRDLALVSSRPIHEICPWVRDGCIYRTMEVVNGTYWYWLIDLHPEAPAS